MTLEEIYEKYRKWSIISDIADVTPNAVYKWRMQGYIPYKVQVYIEMKTHGEFVADVKHGKPSDRE